MVLRTVVGMATYREFKHDNNVVFVGQTTAVNVALRLEHRSSLYTVRHPTTKRRSDFWMTIVFTRRQSLKNVRLDCIPPTNALAQ